MPDTTPSAIQRLRASSSGPNRSGSITAIGRAPIEKMSRRIPPTPVAAPWYGSTAEGWLWLSMRSAAAMPSPTSITPAPSPGPTSTHGASVGRRRRCTRDDLYEQCSDHMTPYIANSRSFGGRSVIEEELSSSDPLTALNLRQERRDLQAELAGMGEKVDIAEVEKAFVSAAKDYGKRRGISYEVWREAGVPPEVLKQAGISRS